MFAVVELGVQVDDLVEGGVLGVVVGIVEARDKGVDFGEHEREGVLLADGVVGHIDSLLGFGALELGSAPSNQGNQENRPDEHFNNIYGN